jgi:hypothetical protein
LTQCFTFLSFLLQVGKLIALTVEAGEDWKDVQIPAADETEDESKKSGAAAAIPSSGKKFDNI